MTTKRYWVIAPYDSAQAETFSKAWEYDLTNRTIAIGWNELGDISKLSQSELKSKCVEIYDKRPNPTRVCNKIWRFYHEISREDIIIARRGRKSIVGIGEVKGRAFYDNEKGKQRVGDSTGNTYFYPNLINVEWERREIQYDKIVFAYHTIYEIPEDKYQSLIRGTP